MTLLKEVYYGSKEYKDVITAKFMSNDVYFKDLFNVIFEMNGVNFRLGDLTSAPERDDLHLEGKEGVNYLLKRCRDVFKAVTIKEDDNNIYVLLGIENQTKIDHTMLFRCFLYDAISYWNQIEQLSLTPNSKRTTLSKEAISSIKPVITVVVNWDRNEWVNPIVDFGELYKDHLIAPLMTNYYRINYINACHCTEEQLNRFKSNLGTVFKFLSYQKDKNKFSSLINSRDESIRNLDKSCARVINLFSKLDLNIDDSDDKEEFDMCEALKEIIADKMAEKDAEIAELSSQLEKLNEKYAEFAELSSQLEKLNEKDAEIAEKDAEIARLRKQLDELNKSEKEKATSIF